MSDDAATRADAAPARRGWIGRLAIIGPLVAFAAFVAIVAGQLGRPTQVVIESKMIGKPLPAFDLPGLDAASPGLKSSDFAHGKPMLVNVMASWCLPCQAEAPQLDALAKQGVIINAIAVRDAAPDMQAFLARHGNPFAHIGLDTSGRTQIDFGSAGVPETFIVDGTGHIRYQHIGEIRAEHVAMLMTKLAEAGK